MDVSPIAMGHALVIPKWHGEKLHDVPDEYLSELLPIAKKIAIASNLDIEGMSGDGYNVLQNNGSIAHQVVPHVHVHLIPKCDTETGLIVGWPQPEEAKNAINEVHAKLVEKINKL
jgi:diadenosine tetraphosphate (Ap4A) HIT family hydrolase